MRLALILAAALALGGCAILSKPEPAPPGVENPQAWRERRAELTDFATWSLQGRAATGKILGWTGNLNWRQDGETFHVRVSGPLGAGGFRADGTLASVKVRTDKETFVTREPEAVVEQVLGWRFPLTGLRYWVLGLPEPDKAADLSVDERGLLVGLKQSGWTLGYPEYTEVDGHKLPRKIVLHNGDHTINVVIDRWFGLDQAN